MQFSGTVLSLDQVLRIQEHINRWMQKVFPYVVSGYFPLILILIKDLMPVCRLNCFSRLFQGRRFFFLFPDICWIFWLCIFKLMRWNPEIRIRSLIKNEKSIGSTVFWNESAFITQHYEPILESDRQQAGSALAPTTGFSKRRDDTEEKTVQKTADRARELARLFEGIDIFKVFTLPDHYRRRDFAEW